MRVRVRDMFAYQAPEDAYRVRRTCPVVVIPQHATPPTAVNEKNKREECRYAVPAACVRNADEKR